MDDKIKTTATIIPNEIEVNISIEDVINEINEMPITSRMSFITNILNGINTVDIQIMSDRNKETIKKYLQLQLKRY